MPYSHSIRVSVTLHLEVEARFTSPVCHLISACDRACKPRLYLIICITTVTRRSHMQILWNQQYAQRTKRMSSSAIRELLKLTELPDVISFGGGLPAPEVFPV